MRLAEFLSKTTQNQQLSVFFDSKDFSEIEISDLEIDSRKISKNSLKNSAFFALPGIKNNGSDFVFSAAKNGAKAIFMVYDEGFALQQFRQNFPQIPLIISSNHQQNFKLLIEFLTRLYQPKPTRVYGITGTNGKTSVAEFTRQIAEILGYKSASIGTLGIISDHFSGDFLPNFSLTTPDIASLHQALFLLKKQEIEDVAIEVSSIGLQQNRVSGLDFSLGCFTNFSQDHLDYHITMENYFAAKTLLFSQFISPGGKAVLNADIVEFEQLAKICQNRGIEILDYGFKANSLRIKSLKNGELNFDFAGRNYSLKMPVSGDFQAFNLLAAIGNLVSSLDLKAGDLKNLLPMLSSLCSAPGRMEFVEELSNGAKIFIDFAHTPEALRNLLENARNFTNSKLIVLFGCGGDRDAKKRPLMGKIASDLADFVIVTDDNPRSENPAKIRQEIIQNSNSTKILEIADRKAAIKQAISMLLGNEILILAGKGHEKYQIIGQEKLPFDEKKIALEEIFSQKNKAI